MIQKGLVNNSVSAFQAAIEIHNKPDFSYRYETVSLLLLNAWELALKAFVRKKTKASVFERDGHSISFNKALRLTSEHIENEKKGSFQATRVNLSLLYEFRNKSAHFYSDEIDPIIFSLIAKASTNYSRFMQSYFGIDPLAACNLTILPLGFKLPFEPEGFLSKQVVEHGGSEQFVEFLTHIVDMTVELDRNGIEDSVLLGFRVHIDSTKSVSNADIIAAIKNDESSIPLRQKKVVRLCDDPSAQPVYLSDDDFFRHWPLDHADLVLKCRVKIDGFKQDKRFNEAKKIIRRNSQFAGQRSLDKANKSTRWYYSESAVDEIERLLDNKPMKEGNPSYGLHAEG